MHKRVVHIILAIIIMLLFLIAILFCTKEYVDPLNKVMRDTKIIKLYNYKTKELILTYSQNDTKKFIESIETNKWRETNPLNGDEKLYLMKLFIDEDTEEVATLTIYKSYKYVELNIEEKDFTQTYQTNSSLKKKIITKDPNKWSLVFVYIVLFS